MQIALNLPNGTQEQADTARPIILLGPNGVGKTRFAVDLNNRNNPHSERITANRYIGLTDLPRQADNDLKSNTTSAMQRQNSEYWNVHNEYTFLMSQILEEDKSSAQKYREAHLNGAAIAPEFASTRLRKLTALWESLFPGRKLNLDYSPTVTRDGQAAYPTGQMSEGERTALYLITRLVSSKAAILIVDEPEIHFHPLLAREFWNAMEAYKESTLFVYVTHDIPFALSRSNPLLYVVRSPGTFDVINDAEIPPEAINAILGAASFSISAKRLIFCEGSVGGKDNSLFSAWYNCPNTAVIPVGGCEMVERCVAVFNGNHATRNVTAFGHVDRDDWPDGILNRSDTVRPLPVNEIEGIICFEPIFHALAKFYNHPDGAALYNRFLQDAKNSVAGVILNKHALNRAKLVLELDQQEMRNSVKPNADRAIMRRDYLANITTPEHAATILDNEINALTAAATNNELLLKFPAKTYAGTFPHLMQVTAEKAFSDLCAALTAEDDGLADNAPKKELRDALIAALSDKFFARTAP